MDTTPPDETAATAHTLAYVRFTLKSAAVWEFEHNAKWFGLSTREAMRRAMEGYILAHADGAGGVRPVVPVYRKRSATEIYSTLGVRVPVYLLRIFDAWDGADRPEHMRRALDWFNKHEEPRLRKLVQMAERARRCELGNAGADVDDEPEPWPETPAPQPQVRPAPQAPVAAPPATQETDEQFVARVRHSYGPRWAQMTVPERQKALNDAKGTATVAMPAAAQYAPRPDYWPQPGAPDYKVMLEAHTKLVQELGQAFIDKPMPNRRQMIRDELAKRGIVLGAHRGR